MEEHTGCHHAGRFCFQKQEGDPVSPLALWQREGNHQKAARFVMA